jgi:hypothetical protein
MVSPNAAAPSDEEYEGREIHSLVLSVSQYPHKAMCFVIKESSARSFSALGWCCRP